MYENNFSEVALLPVAGESHAIAKKNCLLTKGGFKGILCLQMSNGPLPHDDVDNGNDLDAINELQFKLDKKKKELEKVR